MIRRALTEFDEEGSPSFLSEGRENDDAREVVVVVRHFLLEAYGMKSALVTAV